jgi:hypothetical protein
MRASSTCAVENIFTSAAAVSPKLLGSTTVACAGQVILTTAGSESGSTSSMLMVSWLIWPEANGVMGDDWDTADSVSVEVPSGAFNLLAGPTYLGGPTRLNGIFTSADSARSLHGVLTIVNESAYG